MAHMDIFNNDAFSAVSLTAAFNRVPFTPSLLGSLPGLVTPQPIRTKHFSIEERNGVLQVLQTSERGAPPQQRTNEKRNIRAFQTVRIAEEDTIQAREIASIRAFGSETELQGVQDEVMRRFAGPTGLQRAVGLTFENMRLGMVQGIVKDADGSTITDWFSEWGIAQPAEIDFALGTATTKVRQKCMDVRRAMKRAAAGSWIEGVTQVHSLAGDGFFDDLIEHPAVARTYENWQAAQELREAKDFEAFYFGGIYFHNYRGTDNFDKDATGGVAAIGVHPDKAVFFPVNAPGVFQHVMSPADEFLPFIDTLGQEIYGLTIIDRDRQAWVKEEVYSYPLFVCTRPAMLQRAKRAA